MFCRSLFVLLTLFVLLLYCLYFDLRFLITRLVFLTFLICNYVVQFRALHGQQMNNCISISVKLRLISKQQYKGDAMFGVYVFGFLLFVFVFCFCFIISNIKEWKVLIYYITVIIRFTCSYIVKCMYCITDPSRCYANLLSKAFSTKFVNHI